MSDPRHTDTVRSSSIGVPGRALNSTRTHHFILDSSSGPSEALTNSEAFLAGVASCGVTLIEKYAKDTGVATSGMEVEISGERRAKPASFARIEMRFEIRGVSQAEAERLVGVWQER